jgi:hypothetical protein
MAYIPKNKIKTNLSTNGNEFIIERSQAVYSGYFYRLYNGEAYTGKFPGDGKNEKLIPARPSYTDAPPNSLTTTSIPPLYPTPDDYKNGMFNRYFSKKRNEYLFEELTKDQYDQLNNPNSTRFTLYKPFFIKWMLTGDEQTVANYNFYSIRNAEEKESVLGLNEFLQMNYLQYYKG